MAVMTWFNSARTRVLMLLRPAYAARPTIRLASKAMIEITTNSSIKVKASGWRLLRNRTPRFGSLPKVHSITEEWTLGNEPNRGVRLRSRRHPLAFTLIELLVVISIIALLASLIVGLAAYAGRSNIRTRVRAELNQVITAIDAYKAHFGHYPPDNYL